MELAQLRYFCAVAQSQHVTQTAEKLHIAQPALTQSIHRLEKELGVPLFAAKGRGIVLTEYGRFLQRKLTPVLQTLEQLPQELSAMANIERGTIHMNVLAASTVITSSIIEYKRIQQHINFQLFQNTENDVCDIDVSTRLFYQAGGGGKNAYVFTERIFLAVPVTGRYTGRSAISLSEVAGEEFICLAGSKQFRSICDNFCTHAGFTPKVIFESDSPFAVRNLIAAGMGIGFWPEHSWGPLDTSDMLLLSIEAPICQRDLVITCNQNKVDNTEVRNYFDFLVSYLQSIAKNPQPQRPL